MVKLSRRFPLNALRVFEAVARLENFTRAAEELGMTQTAVSYQIKLLEEFLGDAVFIRRPRALQLTETGARLLPKVSDAFALLSDAMSDARQAVGETLEIRSPPTFASHWLSPRLGTFRTAHPDITVRLVRLIDAADHPSGTPDVIIRISAEPPEGMVSHPLMRLRYSPMISPDVAAGIGGIREPADLLKLPWISEIDGTWLDWFEHAKIDPKSIRPTNLNALGAQDLEARAAISGHGVAMLSPFFFRDDLAAGRLVQPFDLSVGDGKTYWLACPQARRNARKVVAFRRWIEEAIAADLSKGDMGALAHADLDAPA
jgi:LysR family transcriptional regulator, glycine cleavage system transcriptional activator